MSKKPGLTLEQHRELGQRLKEITEQLQATSVLVSNAYPRKRKACACAARAVIAVQELRCELDDELCAEIPRGSGDWRCVYYGPSSPR